MGNQPYLVAPVIVVLLGCASAGQPHDYVLSVNDTLVVSIARTEHHVIVQPSGTIKIPQLGTFSAKGRTALELASAISGKSNNTVVSVTLGSAKGQDVPSIENFDETPPNNALLRTPCASD